MTQPREGITQNVAERLCWEGARRDATRIARRLSRQPVVDGVDRLDDGALLDDFFPFLQAIGVMELLEEAHGAAIPRAMVPFVPSVLLDGVKTWFGIERIKALPNLLCSEAALMPLGGGKAPQVRQGICQRGASKRQGERAPGPLGPDTLALNIVKGNRRDLEVVCKGAIRALAKAGVFGQQVTGLADGTDLETTEHDPGCGHVTRQVRMEEKRGRVHAIEVTV